MSTLNNPKFSKIAENLRLVWSASSLEAYMKDPLSYYWHNVLGYNDLTPKAALVWGTLWHAVTASYKDLRSRGFDRDEALGLSIVVALKLAKDRDLDVVSVNSTKRDVKTRNTYTLIRTLIWWEQKYHNDELKVVEGEDGPLIEQHFSIPLGLKAYTGEDYVIEGYLDEIVEDEDGDQFVLERKHTIQTISSYYFYQYDPNVQTWTYDLVASVLLPMSPLQGLIVEAAQTGVGFAAFERHPISRTKEQRAHWLEVMRYWIQRAEKDAYSGTWINAMNPATTTYESKWKDIQRKTPAMWKAILETEMSRAYEEHSQR